MPFNNPRMPSTSLHHSFFCMATKNRSQKLECIANELLDLTKLECYDYSILLQHKFGVHQYALVGSASSLSTPSSAGSAFAGAQNPLVEKTAFDIKLEKFDAAAKIKIIKEVRTFTDLGLKKAKDLVEKAPIVLKKGVTKEEAGPIVDKLKEISVTVVLE